MISQRLYCSKIQGKKVKVGDDANHDVELVSDFLKEADEDILFEIFLRLPNCRSAIVFGSVCHCWHSLISQPQFIRRFISHHHEHQDRYPLPYTIIFREAEKKGFKDAQYFQPICKLFSEESKLLHGTSSTSYLDFLPSPMVIRASCNDLLLVSPSARWSTANYICNPITKQFYQLPEIRRPSMCIVTRHALVCMPDYSNKEVGFSTNQFKVVEFYRPCYPDPELEEARKVLSIMIFCSKSRKWERKCFRYPRPWGSFDISSMDVVACNGILYWLEYECAPDRVISLDLLRSQCGVIDFPDDFWWFRWEDSHVREQIGAVLGELRLLQVLLTGMESIVNLKVWKLNYNKDDSSWVLVHDKKKLKRPNNEKHLVALFVHPTNCDVVFMVWGKNVFQYNLIMEDTYEIIDELPEPLKLNSGYIRNIDGLMSFPMVHPTWPTPLPRG